MKIHHFSSSFLAQKATKKSQSMVL